MALLEISDLNIRYLLKGRESLACDRVELCVEQGDSVGIIGESGSGKSTLALGLLGLLPKDITRAEGKILFQNENLLELDDAARAKTRWKALSAVFQKSMNTLSPVHKIGRQIEGIYRVHVPDAKPADCRALAKELFEKVNLPESVYNLYPHQLSGGMIQRVSIALSLMFHPSLIVFDEATTALDVVTEGQILREIVRLQESEEMTFLMITHNIGVVSSSCKKVAVLYAGRIMETGLTVDILRRPRHPYTQGLLRSFPSFTGEKSSLRGITGNLPDLSEPHAGCIFAPRCARARENCRIERPPLQQIAPGWSAACFYAKEETA